MRLTVHGVVHKSADCGPVQLRSSREVVARNRLRAALAASGLSILEFAEAIGVVARTIDWHLAGTRRMTQERARWYNRLQHIEQLEGGYVRFTVRIRPTRKRANFRREPLKSETR